MKKVFIALLLSIATLGAQEKPEKSGLMQAYKNWASARTIAHFTQPQAHNSNGTHLEQCRSIPLKDLHAELNRQVRNRLFMDYVVVPTVFVGSLAVIGIMTYKNIHLYP
jgi:hypothetical protein